MTFEDIRGNEDVIRALKSMVDSGRVPHAIMFHENNGGGAFPLTLAFLQYLFYGDNVSSKISNLMHPDIHYVFPVTAGTSSEEYLPQLRELIGNNPEFTESQLNDSLGIEGKSAIITVAQAKTILEKLAFNSLEGGYRAIVVYLPEKMNAEASNRLLKSIEEPSERTQYIFITHSPEKVLRTISSRCQNIRVRPSSGPRPVESEDESQFNELFISLTDALLSRNLIDSLEVGETLAALPSREKMKAFCSFFSERMRTLFLVQQNVTSLSGEADTAIVGMASKFRKTFPRLASGIIDRTQLMIERNVNQKILFTDMVNRLYQIV